MSNLKVTVLLGNSTKNNEKEILPHYLIFCEKNNDLIFGTIILKSEVTEDLNLFKNVQVLKAEKSFEKMILNLLLDEENFDDFIITSVNVSNVKTTSVIFLN